MRKIRRKKVIEVESCFIAKYPGTHLFILSGRIVPAVKIITRVCLKYVLGYIFVCHREKAYLLKFYPHVSLTEENGHSFLLFSKLLN